jgi:hypothetical protein
MREGALACKIGYTQREPRGLKGRKLPVKSSYHLPSGRIYYPRIRVAINFEAGDLPLTLALIGVSSHGGALHRLS